MIKGFRGTSLIDYPGKICSVIYTYGCNFCCPYCYNLDLVVPERYKKLKDISEKEIIEELKRRKGFIKGVTITGGEPTIWGKKLINLIKRIYYEVNLPIKLDTNGSNPDIIKELFEKGLVDFWGVDFKTAPHRYPEINGEFDKVEKTFLILSNIPEKVEIRITFYPPLISEKELKEMLPYLKNFKYIAFQKYLPYNNLTKNKNSPYSNEFYNKAKELFKKELPLVEIRERF